ncbi:MAG: AMMECR1 domain-containing protein [Thermoanaerobaculia bacterium]|nr:AMMECR1 domain-containing protein [Thermoanaerobaculia bacterium]
MKLLPDDIKAAWEAAGRRSAGTRRSWLKRLAKHPQQGEFDRAIAGRLPEAWHEALAALRPFEDGILIEHGGHRATFLPQVWEQLPRPVEFLRRLKEKAGLAPGFWHPELKVYRYAVRKWEEGELGAVAEN